MMAILQTTLLAVPTTNEPGLNGIWGNPAAIFVGTFNDTRDCIAATLAWGYPTGDRLYSFTHHLPNFPGDFATKCFGLSDHTWKPVPDDSQPPIITSGRILYPEPACGGDSAPGCTWRLDPHCLNDQWLLYKATLSTADAAKRCAADRACVAFSLPNSSAVANASIPDGQTAEHSFYNQTDGNVGGCFAYRRHFAVGADAALRTTFHFQPAKNWMNDVRHGLSISPRCVGLWLVSISSALALTPTSGVCPGAASDVWCLRLVLAAQRPHVRQRPLPPLLSVQPVRSRGLCAHSLGARGLC